MMLFLLVWCIYAWRPGWGAGIIEIRSYQLLRVCDSVVISDLEVEKHVFCLVRMRI
jgi:hypothetical protein